jgi:hypothetical protein
VRQFVTPPSISTLKVPTRPQVHPTLVLVSGSKAIQDRTCSSRVSVEVGVQVRVTKDFLSSSFEEGWGQKDPTTLAAFLSMTCHVKSLLPLGFRRQLDDAQDLGEFPNLDHETQTD